MKRNEIERIFVVRDEDLEHNKYISQILIEYSDKKKKDKYFSLDPGKLKGSSKRIAKAEQKMEEQLNKVLKNLEKEDYKKILFVKDNDQLLRRYVDKSIKISESKSCAQVSKIYTSTNAIVTASNLFMLVSPVHTAVNVLFVSMNALVSGLSEIKNDRKRNSLPKVEPKWVKNLRFSFNMFLLSLNLTLGAANLKVGLNEFASAMDSFKLETQANAQPVFDSLDNPFDNDSLITSADEATNILMTAFDLNPLLEEGDRLIAQSLRQYIKENPYFNYEKCYEDFATFELITTNQGYGNVGARNEGSIIRIFNIDNKTYEDYMHNLEHELVHYTGNLDNFFLNEGMTTLICSEYMNDFYLTSGYFDQVLGTKILCELITPEKMLEAYSKENMGIIETELAKICPEKCYTLLDIMQKYHSKLTKAAHDGREKLIDFYSEESPKFKEDFSNLVAEFVENANLTDVQIQYISNYLSMIGEQMNVRGVIYFNRSADKPDYIKAYSTDTNLEIQTGYSY